MGAIEFLWRAARSGFLGWLLHRITGVALVVLLFTHIFYFDYALMTGMEVVSGLPAFVFYATTLAFGLYHGLNGLKIFLGEMGYGLKHRVRLNVVMLVLWIVGFAWGSWIFWKLFLGV